MVQALYSRPITPHNTILSRRRCRTTCPHNQYHATLTQPLPGPRRTYTICPATVPMTTVLSLPTSASSHANAIISPPTEATSQSLFFLNPNA